VTQGLVTLLILPIANAANQHLQSNDTYWKLNVAQVRLNAVREHNFRSLSCA
jgi:hypothetical protein